MFPLLVSRFVSDDAGARIALAKHKKSVETPEPGNRAIPSEPIHPLVVKLVI
jgi:hypothetical protein